MFVRYLIRYAPGIKIDKTNAQGITGWKGYVATSPFMTCSF